MNGISALVSIMGELAAPPCEDTRRSLHPGGRHCAGTLTSDI